jgi:hypothetical protein
VETPNVPYFMLVAALIGLSDPPTEKTATPAPAVPAAPSSDGFWPTPKMLDSILLRWVDEITAEYDLDTDQVTEIRKNILNRWPKFLNSRRSTLQPLVNEHFELRLALEPPSTEQVQNWAERALSIYDEFKTEVEGTHQELRTFLDPVQRAKFDLDAMKMGVGLEVFGAKLQSWQRGEFSENEWWDPTPSVRRTRRAEKGAQQEPSDNPARSRAKLRINEELLRWNLYVAEFVEQFKLDEAQRETAYSILRECRQRALDHRDRFRARLERLEKDLAERDEPTDEQSLEMAAMYNPVDTIFAELKSRLDQIPTTVQASAQPKTPPAPKSEPKPD